MKINSILLEAEEKEAVTLADLYFDKDKPDAGFKTKSSFQSLAPNGESLETWNGDFRLEDFKITSLKGFPKLVKGDINLSRLPITNLEGIGKSTGWTYLSGLKIKNFEGIVDVSHLSVAYCQLENLNGLPEHLHNLVIGHCSLDSFEGFPKFVTNFQMYGILGLTSAKEITFKNIDKFIKAAGVLSFDGVAIDDSTPLLGFLNIKQLTKIEYKPRISATSKSLEGAFEIINKYLPEGDVFECQNELIDAGYHDQAKI